MLWTLLKFRITLSRLSVSDSLLGRYYLLLVLGPCQGVTVQLAYFQKGRCSCMVHTEATKSSQHKGLRTPASTVQLHGLPRLGCPVESTYAPKATPPFYVYIHTYIYMYMCISECPLERYPPSKGSGQNPLILSEGPTTQTMNTWSKPYE